MNIREIALIKLGSLAFFSSFHLYDLALIVSLGFYVSLLLLFSLVFIVLFSFIVSIHFMVNVLKLLLNKIIKT